MSETFRLAPPPTCIVKSRVWNRLGTSGVKFLIALHELGGRDVWVDDAFEKAEMGYGNIYKLKGLEEMGLVRFEKRVVNNTVRLYASLTEAGSKVAMALRLADEFLPSAQPQPQSGHKPQQR